MVNNDSAADVAEFFCLHCKKNEATDKSSDALVRGLYYILSASGLFVGT